MPLFDAFPQWPHGFLPFHTAALVDPEQSYHQPTLGKHIDREE
jgi:hypothetical protein